MPSASGRVVNADRCPMIGGPPTKPAQPKADTVATAPPGCWPGVSVHPGLVDNLNLAIGDAAGAEFGPRLVECTG